MVEPNCSAKICPNFTATTISHIKPVLPYETVLQIAIHTFIFVGGFLGNSFLITIILHRKKMQTVTNWLVLNLAVSDMAIILLVIPTANILPLINWPFGERACQYLVYPVLEHFAGVSVLTHTALSTARFIFIKNAMSGRVLNVIHVKFIIIAIWIVAFLIMSATLMGLFGRFQLMHRGGQLVCGLIWVSRQRRMVYRFTIFTLTYIIPMTLSGFAYFKIHKSLTASIKHLSGCMSSEDFLKRQKNSRRTDNILMIMYIMFAFTTLPLQIFYVVNDFGLVPSTYASQMSWLSLVALFYAQVVSNPLTLLYMGKDYRIELYRLPMCICAPRARLRSISSAFLESFVESMRHRRKSSASECREIPGITKKRNSKGSIANKDCKLSGSKEKDDGVYMSPPPHSFYGHNSDLPCTLDALEHNTEVGRKKMELTCSSFL
ncbi:kappa-type opioid receptor-like [Hydractinia symbiolongicarpus]|uniref:kappa-type opioid receptor-like n=1 Tax=Hydractinia symbiolongicarpus TaxID=13093 RepID=UPI00254B164D|nr:kappa-type opioid receptor-like [Hydractinia symbiolongicarpus]